MPNEQKDRRDDWRYILRLEYEGMPVWLETKRLPGLPEGRARIKVGNQHYFLEAAPGAFFHDIATDKMICFLEVTNRIRVTDIEFDADGRSKARGEEDKKTDAYPFMRDDRFQQIEKPF